MASRRVSPEQILNIPGLTYLLAFIATLLVSGVLMLFRGRINSSIIALLYILPVALSSALWGLKPGITAAFISFLAFNFLFIPPYYTLMVHQTLDLLALLVFLGTSVFISQMFAQNKLSLAKARDHERETISLSELISQLAGLTDDREIATRLAAQTLAAFRAEQVIVLVDAPVNGGAISILQKDASIPEGRSSSVSQPNLVAPLQSAQGLIGEIQLYRRTPPISATETRLLHTFASQAVLALERARLLQTEQRARVLEENDRFKSSLLSSVSHELRSPLAAIKAAITSLQDDDVAWDSEGRRDLLDMVEEETDHLNLLVGNLLNMSRIEAGALKPEKSWNALSELVGDVLGRLHQYLLRHQIDVDVPDDLPLVPVDYYQMDQVITNLVSNSVKYSPIGSRLRIHSRQLDEHTLLFCSSNQGPSVPEEDLERIFDKFYRTSSTNQIGGTGLGLSICKGIVEAHGGKIWAENLPDGFQICFTIPLDWEAQPMEKIGSGTI